MTLRRLLFVLLLAALVWLGLVTFRVGPSPEAEIATDLPGIGRSTTATATFREPVRGLGKIRLELTQGERSEVVAEAEFTPRPAWRFWGARTPEATLEANVGRDAVEWLRQGSALLRAVAEPPGTWLRRPVASVTERELAVRLSPPPLAVLSDRHYPAQGGSEVVVYTVGDTSVRDGVEAGSWFFSGHPLPGGGPRQRFALYGVPFDLDDPAALRLIAEDDVGNRATASFVDRFFPHAFKTDDIEISERFMASVVPEIQAQTPGLAASGDLLADYLEINRDVRRRNAQTLIELAEASRDAFLWSAPFQTMPNAQVMSAFADRRTYLFAGREVDRQDHLGFDLASVQRAPIPAANDGVVALAGYFGIYGNAVVLDHGFGLMSLYGHLSSIAVNAGQPVVRGQEIGRSGATGLAAGDHLHFTFLLGGLAVNPVEWWDAAWIRDRIARKLGPGLPYSP
jgi:murein DD-endopeptidase MepM/ murein hydrolase activator NlpD